MGDVFLGARVLAVQVAAVGQQLRGRHLPGRFIFLPVGPPLDQGGEFLELDGGCFGVVLAAFGERLFVIPDLAGRAGAVEEQDVGGDAGVGGKDTVGQADDGVEVEFLEEFFLDASADTIAKQGAIGDDHGGAGGPHP